MDIRLFEELTATKDLTKISPRDFRKISSPSFHKMSFDKIVTERRIERSMGQRKASLEFRKSPDFRRGDYRWVIFSNRKKEDSPTLYSRKLSVDRFSIDCAKYLLDEMEIRSRANSGENLRRQRQPKLHHSRSDDNKRQSFDKPKDAQSSRHSLNTQAVVESGGSEGELKYFAATSLDTEESRADNSEESRTIEVDDNIPTIITPDGPTEADALLEEPELENLTENDVENSRHDRRGIRRREKIGIETERLIMMERGQNTKDFGDNEETILYVEDDEV